MGLNSLPRLGLLVIIFFSSIACVLCLVKGSGSYKPICRACSGSRRLYMSDPANPDLMEQMRKSLGETEVSRKLPVLQNQL